MPNRREFLSQAAAAAVSRESAIAAAVKEEWRNRHAPMAYSRLGRTGFMVSRMVMGGNMIAPGSWEHVLAALDMGLNYLDTAPDYGRGKSETAYRNVITARRREQFFLTTKVSLWDKNRNALYKAIFDGLPETGRKRLRDAVREDIAASGAFAPDYVCDYFDGQRRELDEATLSNLMEKQYGRDIDRARNYRQVVIDSLEASLRRLGTDHVDILMCPHGASTAAEMLNYPEVFDAFEALRKAGKVRHLGVSAHTNSAAILRAAAKSGVYSVAMVAYNIVNHSFVDAALEEAHAAGVGVIAMKVARPVNNGQGRPDDPRRVKTLHDAVPGALKTPQKAYVWALRNPRIAAVNSELTSLQLVRENLPLAAARG